MNVLWQRISMEWIKPIIMDWSDDGRAPSKQLQRGWNGDSWLPESYYM